MPVGVVVLYTSGEGLSQPKFVAVSGVPCKHANANAIQQEVCTIWVMVVRAIYVVLDALHNTSF